jgi:hypothetical protein
MIDYPALPGSAMFLDHLLGLLFILHIIFMNYVLSAPLLIVWYLLTRPGEGRLFAKWLSVSLPVMLTFAINFGVASLLFVQVLYADRFFTANIILGNIWLGVIGLLMVFYYGAFVGRNALAKPDGGAVRAGLTNLVLTALVWAIGLIMIANYFITTDHSQWPSLLQNPLGVLHNNTFIPRALHFFFGGLAVTGFWMVWISWWRVRRGAPETECLSFRRQGLLLAAAATGLQVIDGIWFLLWQPSEIWDALFSGTIPGLVWISGVATGLIMLGVLIVAAVFPGRTVWQKSATILLFWTLIGMVAGRDVIRHTLFGKEFSPAVVPSSTQVNPMLIFLLLFLAGIGVILWLIQLIWVTPPKPDQRPDE